MNRDTFADSSASQNHLILRHLSSGKTLTPLSALRLFNCLRLGARIYDLKGDGHRIKSEMIKISDGKRVAKYSMSVRS